MHKGTRRFRTITNAKIAARNIKARYLARRIPEEQRVAVVIECVNLGSINADVLCAILNGETFIQERVTFGPVAPSRRKSGCLDVALKVK